MSLTSKERADLRADAHHLRPLVHVGHEGLTPAIKKSLDDALRTKELVKVQLARTTEVSAKEAASELAEAMGAEIVQTIGRTTTLFRFNPELERKKGKERPWRE